MSFWERHKAKIYHYGHIYATLYGLMVINYIPARPTNTWTHRLTVLYSHVVGALLIVVCPVYFISHCDALLETKDRRQQLQLVVNFVNTLIKYVTVVVTYGANLAQYTAMREITKTRQQLEDAFEGSTLANAQCPFNADVTESEAGLRAGTRAVETKGIEKATWTRARTEASIRAGNVVGSSNKTEAWLKARNKAGADSEAGMKRAEVVAKPKSRACTKAGNIAGFIEDVVAGAAASTEVSNKDEPNVGISAGTAAGIGTKAWNEEKNIAGTAFPTRSKIDVANAAGIEAGTEIGTWIRAWTKGRIKARRFVGAEAGIAAKVAARAPTVASSRVAIAAGTAARIGAEADATTQSDESQRPRHQFERMLLFKFGLINAMMLLQVASILYQHYGLNSQPVRLHYAIYTFVLWNYTENMADYFYFINCSTLRFYRQLQQQLQQLLRQAHSLHTRSGGYAMELCNQLCDRLDELAARCQQIQRLYGDGVRMQQFQILGLIFTALISNLTNFFSLFNLFSKHALDQASPEIALSLLHALVFYVDTYIVTLISDHISGEKAAIGSTMQRFNGIAGLDVRLEQTIERFTLQLLHSKADVRICGFFYLNRHLAFLTAAAGFSYFITLVQFDLSFY